MLSGFSRIAITSQGTLHLALGLIGMHSTAGGKKVFIFVICSMSQMFPEKYQISFLKLSSIYC